MPSARTEIAKPKDEEKRWMAGHQMRALMLGRAHGDPATATTPSFAALDRAWVAESATIRESDGDPNPLIQALGVALGQHFVDQLGLVWVIATDPVGTEVAVHEPTGDTLVYPLNLVAKRWERREGAFIAALALAMTEDITRLKQGLAPR